MENDKEDYSRIQVSQMKFTIVIIQKTKRDKIINGEIWDTLDIEKLLDILERNSMKLFVHVSRLSDHNNQKCNRNKIKGKEMSWNI